jgi:hypothetical protein
LSPIVAEKNVVGKGLGCVHDLRSMSVCRERQEKAPEKW